eukprot:5216400-Alexandrium_andersonii.AAC.1
MVSSDLLKLRTLPKQMRNALRLGIAPRATLHIPHMPGDLLKPEATHLHPAKEDGEVRSEALMHVMRDKPVSHSPLPLQSFAGNPALPSDSGHLNDPRLELLIRNIKEHTGRETIHDKPPPRVKLHTMPRTRKRKERNRATH